MTRSAELLLACPLSDLVDTARRRPAGYLRRVLSTAVTVSGDFYVIRYADWAALCREYRGDAPRHSTASGRHFWGVLHSLIRPTPAELHELVECLNGDRRLQWDGHVRRRPVRWNDFVAWAVEIHNDVAIGLGRNAWPGVPETKLKF